MKRTVLRTDTTGIANPLTGLVFCAGCGVKMYNHRGKRKKDGREYGTDFYNCSTYTLTFERETQMCFSHTVSTKALNALNEYAGLREQAHGFDPVQLYEARQAIRPGKEQEAESRAQEVYGEKYRPILMFDSKKTVSRMLNEESERQIVRRMVRQAQKEEKISYKKKGKEQER